MRSEGVLERFYAMVVFRPLSGRQIYPIANLGNRAAPSASSRVRALTRTHARGLATRDIFDIPSDYSRMRIRMRAHARGMTTNGILLISPYDIPRVRVRARGTACA